MGDRVEGLLTQLLTLKWIAGIVAVAVIVIGLAKFTDALKKLHEFWKGIRSGLRRGHETDAELRKKFDVLRRNVLYCAITNDIPVELHKVRTFLVEHGFVERPDVRRLFDAWLSQIPVVLGVSAVNAFTYDEIKQLTEDLRSLQL